MCCWWERGPGRPRRELPGGDRGRVPVLARLLSFSPEKSVHTATKRRPQNIYSNFTHGK